jgi:pentatricopeptide repeat protein
MIGLCALNRQTERALNFYEEMLQRDMRPTEVT